MLYSFARVSAVIGMQKQDYFRQESRGWLRLHEKGGKQHDVLAHHRAAAALDDYLEAAGLDEAKAALFQSVDPAGRRLTARALSRRLVLAMIKAARRPRICRPRLTATRSGRRGSRRICRTGGRSSTRSRSPGTRRRRRRSSTTGRGGHDHRRRDRAHRDLGVWPPARARVATEPQSWPRLGACQPRRLAQEGEPADLDAALTGPLDLPFHDSRARFFFDRAVRFLSPGRLGK